MDVSSASPSTGKSPNAAAKGREVEGDRIIIEEEAIHLNKHSYMERLLGNKRETYILMVTNEEGEEDTRISIRTAKHIKNSLKAENVAMNVYVMPLNQLEDVRKIANRILDFPVFEKDGSSAGKVEVFLKTAHSREYVHLTWKRESFFTQHKTKKLLRKVERYRDLFVEGAAS